MRTIDIRHRTSLVDHEERRVGRPVTGVLQSHRCDLDARLGSHSPQRGFSKGLLLSSWVILIPVDSLLSVRPTYSLRNSFSSRRLKHLV